MHSSPPAAPPPLLGSRHSFSLQSYLSTVQMHFSTSPISTWQHRQQVEQAERLSQPAATFTSVRELCKIPVLVSHSLQQVTFQNACKHTWKAVKDHPTPLLPVQGSCIGVRLEELLITHSRMKGRSCNCQTGRAACPTLQEHSLGHCSTKPCLLQPQAQHNSFRAACHSQLGKNAMVRLLPVPADIRHSSQQISQTGVG